MVLYYADSNTEATNCEACGQECIKKELKKVKLASIGMELQLCSECAERDSAEDYRSALKDVL